MKKNTSGDYAKEECLSEEGNAKGESKKSVIQARQKGQSLLRSALDILGKYGFIEVKSGDGFVVCENNGVRVKVGLRDGISMLACEIALPNKTELLPFFLGRSFKSSDINVVGPHIHVSNEVDMTQFEDIVIHAANAATLHDKKNANLQEILRPLFLPAEWNVKINPELVALLKERLSAFRALLFECDLTTLIAYIAALKVQAFEIESGALVKNVVAVMSALEQCALHGTIIMLNLNMLDEPSRNAAIHAAEKQLHYPSFHGSRFVYLATNFTLRGHSVPVIQLPGVFTGAKEALVDAGLSTDSNTVSEVGLMTSVHGIRMDAAIESIVRKSRMCRASLDNTTDLRLDKTYRPRPLAAGASMSSVYGNIHALFRKYVVGHHKIVQELSATLAGWHVLGDTPVLLLLFSGPSGTGKNHIAEVMSVCLAELFGVSSHYVSFNCGSMVDKYSLWQLTGVQAGLKGMEKNGILENLPAGGVISFDEVDKVAGGEDDIQNFLIQLLDNGGFRNGFGEWKKAPPSVIVLTMNAGRFAEDERCQKMGFGGTNRGGSAIDHYKDAYEKKLLPALRGRIQKTFFFDYLRREDIKEIALRELDRLMPDFRRLKAEWPLDNEKEAQEIADTSDVALGAREVRNRILDIKNRLLAGITDNGKGV